MERAQPKGFDVSGYQPNADFAKAKKDGATFAIIKVSSLFSLPVLPFHFLFSFLCLGKRKLIFKRQRKERHIPTRPSQNSILMLRRMSSLEGDTILRSRGSRRVLRRRITFWRMEGKFNISYQTVLFGALTFKHASAQPMKLSYTICTFDRTNHP